MCPPDHLICPGIITDGNVVTRDFCIPGKAGTKLQEKSYYTEKQQIQFFCALQKQVEANISIIIRGLNRFFTKKNFNKNFKKNFKKNIQKNIQKKIFKKIFYA
jgi:hypothetical protein